MNATAAAEVDPSYQPGAICVLLGGLNDAYASYTAGEIHAQIETFCAARQAVGWEVIVCTYPNGESVMPALNDSIRANWSGYADALADLGAAPYIGEDANHADPVYWDNPQHATPRGLAIMADSVVKEVRGLM